MTEHSNRPEVAVIGGAMAGLAAAERLSEFADVSLFERQSYDEKRVNCGEFVQDPSLIPLATTAENGFHNDVDGFELVVHGGRDHGPDGDPAERTLVAAPRGYVCDRDVVERQWARRLADRGVTIETGPGANVSPAEFDEFVAGYDYVVDATGQPSLTMRALDRTGAYTGDTVALNATVEGDFDADRCRVYFEGFLGYTWSFPKSDSRANVGIGWAGDERPDDYMDTLRAACERNGIPVPDRSATNVYTIPRGPSLDPAETALHERGVYLVGDAAGIANRYQGEGITQGIRSAYLLGDLIAEGEARRYPDRLYETMKSEYRLARLMRGVWEEHEDPDLLADAVATLEGTTVEELTERPGAVARRLARHPGLLVRLFDRGMARRLYEAYTDSWEYARG